MVSGLVPLFLLGRKNHRTCRTDESKMTCQMAWLWCKPPMASGSLRLPPCRFDLIACERRLEESPAFIPPALAPFHDPAQGYDSREEAIEACRAWREAAELPDEWRGLAARTELYPERNAWYLDEIARLTGGGDTPHLHCGISVHAVVLVRQTTAR